MLRSETIVIWPAAYPILWKQFISPQSGKADAQNNFPGFSASFLCCSLCPLQQLDASYNFCRKTCHYQLDVNTSDWLHSHSWVFFVFLSHRDNRRNIWIPYNYSVISSSLCFDQYQNPCNPKSFITQYQGWPPFIQIAQHFSQAYWWTVFLFSHVHLYLYLILK